MSLCTCEALKWGVPHCDNCPAAPKSTTWPCGDCGSRVPDRYDFCPTCHPLDAKTFPPPPPTHYKGTGQIQPWDVIREFELDFWQGNVVKYMLRAGRKKGSTALEDLDKARNYLDYLIMREEDGDSA